VSFASVDAQDRWLSPSAALQRFRLSASSVPNVSPPAAGQRTRFGFRVGQLCLLIRLDAQSEVVTLASIASIPNVPGWFLGLLHRRGHLLPVFDLHQLLKTGESRHNNRTVLILDQGSDAVGIPIDSLPQPVGLNRTLRHRPPLPEILEAHVPTAYATGRTIWLEFDHRSFFTVVGAQIVS
jgi:chemotaxis signal transduction protein